MLGVAKSECYYAKCHHAECHGAHFNGGGMIIGTSEFEEFLAKKSAWQFCINGKTKKFQGEVGQKKLAFSFFEKSGS
jgi:hypothetical protein